MATNDFLPFGTGAGANVLTQAGYLALASRLSGFQAGVAKSIELNKVWRQSSVMASVLAQFIADTTGQDVLDDGDGAALLAQLETALLAASPGRLLRTSVYRINGGTQQVSIDGGAFTTTGATTFTSLAGTQVQEVLVVGGGGGGGGTESNGGTAASSGSGGGGGGEASSIISGAQTSIAITVGAGGTAGTGSGGGGAGGTSSFGSAITATGGAGGARGLTTTSFPILGYGGQGGLGSLATLPTVRASQAGSVSILPFSIE